MLSLPLLCLAVGYVAAAAAGNRRGGRWPAWRTASWCAGLACASAAVAGPLAAAAHHDFTAHMAGHLLLGMAAPLLLVLAAPVTLALRALPTRQARSLSHLLRSRPARLLTHPVTAAILNAGGLWVLYTTLYQQVAHHPWLHLLMQAHVLTAGYLFTAAIIGVDPAPHRPGPRVRAAVLVAFLAAHGILAKHLYAHPPPGIPEAQAQAGGQLMYYGGDVLDLVLITIFCWQWYAATTPQPGRIHASGENRAEGGIRPAEVGSVADRADVTAEMTFVGNATTLLRLGSFTLLTDPNFVPAGSRVYLGYGAWTRRLLDPAMTMDDLPPLDGVVLSHLHGDHFDRVARAALPYSTPIFTTPQAQRRLRRWKFEEVRGLPTWESYDWSRDAERLRITAVPGRHGPGPAARLLPDVMGSVIELLVNGVCRLRLYITGDTLCRPFLAQVPQRFGDIDAMIVHLGGTRLLGMLLTMDGRQGVEAARLVKPHLTVPVHFDDYQVFKSPLSDFPTRAGEHGLTG